MNIGTRIRACREACGMSQQELAQALWVSRNTISNWENCATTPDIESFVLMSALFGISIDEMVREDPDVMARAVARDRNHLLLVGRTQRNDPVREHTDASGAYRVEVPVPTDPVLGTYPAITVTDRGAAPHAPTGAYRLVQTWAAFNAARYRLEDERGQRIGAIHRGKALFYPYFTIRVDGYERVELKRDLKMGYGVKGISTVYRLSGERLAFTGNVLGPTFGISRAGTPLLNVFAHASDTRTTFSLEITDDSARPLAVGVAMALLLMRDYDRNLVRDTDGCPAA